jgi:small subunit ribosomal protein S18
VNDTKLARPKKKWEGSKYVPKRKVCTFCGDKIDTVDYKDAQKLRQYISERGRIDPRRKTGTCAKHQRAVAVAIKRARHLALIPYVSAHVSKTGGVGIRF